MALTQTRYFRVNIGLLSNVYCLICLIILISYVAQLLLIRKLYCVRPGPHISFKYVRHNHLRFPMMGEVSLETITLAPY